MLCTDQLSLTISEEFGGCTFLVVGGGEISERAVQNAG